MRAVAGSHPEPHSMRSQLPPLSPKRFWGWTGDVVAAPWEGEGSAQARVPSPPSHFPRKPDQELVTNDRDRYSAWHC